MNKTSFLRCFFLFFICCCACNSITKKNTTKILPLDSVAVLIADCYFLESEIHVKQWSYDIKDYAQVKYDAFFKEHGLTKEILVENVQYYFTNEKYAETIMNKVDKIVEQRAAACRDSINIK